jgi:hypothetical protein
VRVPFLVPDLNQQRLELLDLPHAAACVVWAPLEAEGRALVGLEAAGPREVGVVIDPTGDRFGEEGAEEGFAALLERVPAAAEGEELRVVGLAEGGESGLVHAGLGEGGGLGQGDLRVGGATQKGV